MIVKVAEFSAELTKATQTEAFKHFGVFCLNQPQKQKVEKTANHKLWKVSTVTAVRNATA